MAGAVDTTLKVGVHALIEMALRKLPALVAGCAVLNCRSALPDGHGMCLVNSAFRAVSNKPQNGLHIYASKHGNPKGSDVFPAQHMQTFCQCMHAESVCLKPPLPLLLYSIGPPAILLSSWWVTLMRTYGSAPRLQYIF